MRRAWFCLLAFTATALLPAAVAQPPGGWATIKGQVTIPPGQKAPARAALNVTQDKEHCLSKGPILDEEVIVNAKNGGIKNAVVWLRPAAMNAKVVFAPNEIHPDDQKRKPAAVVINQPCCMFTPRVTLARVGDTLEVKNPAPVPHNFFWPSANNGNHNPNIPPGGTFKLPNPLAAETTPIQYKCSIHPWMSGIVRIFDHPYYALTDDDGNFTIPNAPVGAYRVVVWHEKTGFLGGPPGRFGTPVNIVGPVTQAPPLNLPLN
jgi:hypothetical protein